MLYVNRTRAYNYVSYRELITFESSAKRLIYVEGTFRQFFRGRPAPL